MPTMETAQKSCFNCVSEALKEKGSTHNTKATKLVCESVIPRKRAVSPLEFQTLATKRYLDKIGLDLGVEHQKNRSRTPVATRAISKAQN